MSPAHLLNQDSKDRLDRVPPERQTASRRVLKTWPCLVLVTLATATAALDGTLSTARGQEAVPALVEGSDGALAIAGVREAGLRGKLAAFAPFSAEQGLNPFSVRRLEPTLAYGRADASQPGENPESAFAGPNETIFRSVIPTGAAAGAMVVPAGQLTLLGLFTAAIGALVLQAWWLRAAFRRRKSSGASPLHKSETLLDTSFAAAASRTDGGGRRTAARALSRDTPPAVEPRHALELPVEALPIMATGSCSEGKDAIFEHFELAFATALRREHQSGAEAGAPQFDLRHDPVLGDLTDEIAEGTVRVFLLAGLSEHADCRALAQTLIGNAVDRGLSAVLVDAAGDRLSMLPGLSDLAAGLAGYGDVVHPLDASFGEVPWGSLPDIDRRSLKPLTLVEALSDIYHLVIVDTGRLGLGSSLPVFSGSEATLVLVGDGTGMVGEGASEGANEELSALGFEVGCLVEAPMQRREVA